MPVSFRLAACLCSFWVLLASCNALDFIAEYQDDDSDLASLADIGYVIGILPQFSPLSIPTSGGYMVSMTSATGQKYDCLLPDAEAPVLADFIEPTRPVLENSIPLTSLPERIRTEFNKQRKKCFTKTKGWWTYKVCSNFDVSQYHQDPHESKPSTSLSLGKYVPRTVAQEIAGGSLVQHYEGGSEGRKTFVKYICNHIIPKDGNAQESRHLITAVEEPVPLEYHITISTDFACNITSGTSDLDSVFHLLTPIERKCVLLNRGWWTFRFCYLVDVSQIHAENQKKQVLTEKGEKKDTTETIITASFDLGKFGITGKTTSELVQGSTWDTSYLKQSYTGGTPCDIADRTPRQTTVRIYCNPNGEEFQIRDITESKTCAYDMRIDTTLLCTHPLFAPEKPKLKEVTCTPRYQPPKADPEPEPKPAIGAAATPEADVGAASSQEAQAVPDTEMDSSESFEPVEAVLATSEPDSESGVDTSVDEEARGETESLTVAMVEVTDSQEVEVVFSDSEVDSAHTDGPQA